MPAGHRVERRGPGDEGLGLHRAAALELQPHGEGGPPRTVRRWEALDTGSLEDSQGFQNIPKDS